MPAFKITSLNWRNDGAETQEKLVSTVRFFLYLMHLTLQGTKAATKRMRENQQ